MARTRRTRHFAFVTVTWIVLILLVGLGLVFIHDVDEELDRQRQARDGADPVPERPLFEVDPTATGTIAGIVRLAGPVPEGAIHRVEGDDICDRFHPEPFVPSVRVREGRIANVFVRVIATGHDDEVGPGNDDERRGDDDFDPSAYRYADGVDEPEVVVTLRGCSFEPRVAGVRIGVGVPPRGQRFRIDCADPIHSARLSTRQNRAFHASLIRGESSDLTAHLVRTETPAVLVCDLHDWERAYVFVLDHPFHALSDPAGEFTIAGLPPGAYRLRAWWEPHGPGERSTTVDVDAVVERGVESRVEIVFGG